MWIICLVWCWFQELEFQFEFGVARLGWAGTCVFVFPQNKQIQTHIQTQTQTQIQTQILTQIQTDSNPDSNPLLLSPDLAFFLCSTFCYLSLQLRVFLCLVLSSGFGRSLVLFLVVVFILSMFFVFLIFHLGPLLCVCVCVRFHNPRHENLTSTPKLANRKRLWVLSTWGNCGQFKDSPNNFPGFTDYTHILGCKPWPRNSSQL